MPTRSTRTERDAPRGLLLAALAVTVLLTAITIPTLSFLAPRGYAFSEAGIAWLFLMLARWALVAVVVAMRVRRDPLKRVPASAWAQLPLALGIHLVLGLVSLSAFLTLAETRERTSVAAAVVYLALPLVVLLALYRWRSLPFVRPPS